jgi:hypothetical protein
MNRTIRICLTFAVLLITAHRLPAPISEIPEPTATARAKQKKTNAESTNADNDSRSRQATKPTPARAASFAGRWSGTVSGQIYILLSGTETSSSTYSIQVSPDEKTLSVEQRGNDYSNIRLSQIACRREGDGLAWTYKEQGLGFSHPTGTLRMNSNGTASLADKRGPLTITGTLTKQ